MKPFRTYIKESVELDEAVDSKKLLKIFNKLKKNDKIKIKYDSSARKGKDFQTFVVTSPKRTVGKAGVERVIMKHVDNPTGVKYTLYNRNGSVSLAIGDMAASMTDIKESVEPADSSNSVTKAYIKRASPKRRLTKAELEQARKEKAYAAAERARRAAAGPVEANSVTKEYIKRAILTKIQNTRSESVELDEAQKREYEKGDVVVGRRGNFEGTEAVVVSTSPLVVRIGKRKVRVNPSDWNKHPTGKRIRESVELDEALTLSSDDLNAVKKTAQKLAKQSPDLTYYVVKHKRRFFGGREIPYYEVYASVDMHLVRGKAKKVAGYGAKVNMKESVDELDEGTPAYSKAMAAYKNSDTKKVFDILKKKGFRGGPQGDVLVRNILKKNKGNIQKAAAEIEKKYPNLFKESVELDEVYKPTSIASSLKSRQGVTKVLKRKGIGFHTSKGVIMVNPKNLIAAKSALNKEFGGDFEKNTGMKLKATKKAGISEGHAPHDLDEADRPMQFPGKMSGGKMKGKFTNAQLKQLKDAYGKIGRINPESNAYKNLTAHLDGMNKAQLKQLVDAKIPFMSGLARNRLK